MTRTLTLLCLLWSAAAVASPAPQSTPGTSPVAGAGSNSCATCHATLSEPRLSSPVAAHAGDVHAGHGLSCADCHGGNPAVAEPRASMSAAAGFKGKLAGQAQVAACARCHGDAAFMKRFAPSIPVDQAAKYATSGHGRRLASGDLGVATCASCHGAHGITRVTDPKSRVAPGHIAATCGSCHAVFASLLEKSPHQPVFDKACVDCHGNHAIGPADALLGTGDGALCGTCHSGNDDPGFRAAGEMRQGVDRLTARIAAAGGVLEKARHAGMGIERDELALNQARDQLMLARTEVHAFDPVRVKATLATGEKAADQAEAGGRKALDELRFRRRGLAVTLVLILGVVGVLTLKIRQLDRRRAA